jgi:hypothetical protein
MKGSSKFPAASSFSPGFLAAALLYLSCTPGEPTGGASSGRYRVELVAESVDPSVIPDALRADFDEDGELDRVIVTDSSVAIELAGGGGFWFSVREPGQESPRNWDAKVFSPRRDGEFPFYHAGHLSRAESRRISRHSGVDLQRRRKARP